MKNDEQLRLEKQAAFENQQKLFDDHVKHFEQIDVGLEKFASTHHFVLEKNQWHRPCRVLRKKGTPEYVIEISQEGDWKKVPYRDDLPHTVVVVGIVPNPDAGIVHRMSEEIVMFMVSVVKVACACIQKSALIACGRISFPVRGSSFRSASVGRGDRCRA